MWDIANLSNDWPELDALEPEDVLLFHDSPRLFTVRDRQRRQLLVYQCGQDDQVARFLVMPTGPRQLADLRHARVTLREALISQGWTWLIDVDREGRLSNLGSIDPLNLPGDALPVAGVFLTS